MQSLADAFEPEQHHAKEAGFKEEGGQHFIGHERPDHRARFIREDRPVCAEFVGHDDARDDAHGEDDGEDLQPVAEQVEEAVLTGPEPQPFEHRDVAGETDGEAREYKMERDRECELRTRKQKCSCALIHHNLFSAAWPMCWTLVSSIASDRRSLIEGDGGRDARALD